MASTYSNLKIQLMGTGENSGTWGTVTNTNLGTALEEAIVGSADVTFSSADVTLSLTDSNASQTARNLRLNLTGTVSAAQNLVVPAIEKVYLINNTLSYTITVKNSTGTGIAVPAGKTMWVYNNGTNVVDAVTHLTSLTLTTPLAAAQGGTGSNSTTYCNLQANVTGVLPAANGGTGVTSVTGTGSAVLSASPGLTGTPTAPTATNGTSTTQIATTEFVANTNATKANSSITITAGTGLSGGGDLTSNRTLSIASTGVNAGTYGSSSAIPTLVINAQGQITSATTSAVTTPTLNFGTEQYIEVSTCSGSETPQDVKPSDNNAVITGVAVSFGGGSCGRLMNYFKVYYKLLTIS